MINSDCSFDVVGCSDGYSYGNFPHNVFQRIENTTVEFRDNMWKIRNLCLEKKEDEIEKLISSFPMGPQILNKTEEANKMVDLFINSFVSEKHGLKATRGSYIESNADGILIFASPTMNETFIHGLSSKDITRVGNSYMETMGEKTVLYRGQFKLNSPLVNGSIYLNYRDNDLPQAAKVQAYTTTQKDIVFKFEITYNTAWKRILYTKLSFEDENQKFLPATIDCPSNLNPVCARYFQPLADSVFSTVKQELLWIIEARIRNYKIE